MNMQITKYQAQLLLDAMSHGGQMHMSNAAADLRRQLRAIIDAK
jgi:hypothetical protein